MKPRSRFTMLSKHSYKDFFNKKSDVSLLFLLLPSFFRYSFGLADGKVKKASAKGRRLSCEYYDYDDDDDDDCVWLMAVGHLFLLHHIKWNDVYTRRSIMELREETNRPRIQKAATVIHHTIMGYGLLLLMCGGMKCVWQKANLQTSRRNLVF
jgi:hypothetical protein